MKRRRRDYETPIDRRTTLCTHVPSMYPIGPPKTMPPAGHPAKCITDRSWPGKTVTKASPSSASRPSSARCCSRTATAMHATTAPTSGPSSRTYD
ncbi:hypothetical protein BP5796_05393 [Coleophoma crateriformis]|uniref:Uncharacterized protein n=1 Tax=Coleophoma crateriformis TaxID=565419 RepID=A0A3D8S345_9HELO|nr:hypothetical protein BP5796_05393 [Coleophoma crateriformis]